MKRQWWGRRLLRKVVLFFSSLELPATLEVPTYRRPSLGGLEDDAKALTDDWRALDRDRQRSMGRCDDKRLGDV